MNVPENVTSEPAVKAETKKPKAKKPTTLEGTLRAALSEGMEEADKVNKPATHENFVDTVVPRLLKVLPFRRKFLGDREGVTHKFAVKGHEGYLQVGLHSDQTPGEVFITMSKEGSTIRGLMDTIGILLSLCLQYGVPLEKLVEKLRHQSFEPSGFTGTSDIPHAKSIIDYVAHYMQKRFLPDTEAAKPPPDMMAEPKTDGGLAAVDPLQPIEDEATPEPEGD